MNASIASDEIVITLQMNVFIAGNEITHLRKYNHTQVAFLGFVVDTEDCQLSLPENKLTHIRELVHSWQGRPSCTWKELQPLFLSHAAMAAWPGCLSLSALHVAFHGLNSSLLGAAQSLSED